MGDTIWLQRPSEEVPWGFRLQGGKDFQQPLTVQRVTSGSIAASNLSSGDVILRIGEAETALLTHAQAMLQIKTCGNALELRVSKGGVSSGGITSPKVGNYSLPQQQADALHEFTTESNTGSWPQKVSDSQGDYSPRNTSRSLHPLSPPESETGRHPQPGFLRQTSGGIHSPKAPIHQQNNQVSEPPFGARNYESVQPGFQASSPAVVIDDQVEGGLGYHANAPPAPPPLPPISSPSAAAAVQPWKRQNSQPQPRSYDDAPAPAPTDNYGSSSSYPFGVPSKYSNDSGFGQGSPVSNGQQTFGGGAGAGGGGGYPSGGDYDYDTSSYPVEEIQTQPKAAQSPQRMPDAILNMAAKGEGDKKPFSYIADVNAIKEQRDRVRKKTPVCALPRYQHMLNMPQFDDPPRVRNALRTTPSTPPALQNPDSGDAVVANLQFNTPLGLYSNDNVVEALKGQTGGLVSDVVGLSPKQDKTDITQSPVYKMIHGIDQPKAKPVVKFVEAQPSARENTGGSEVDTSSIRRNITGDDSDSGQYDEKSLRYTGKNIPSKSFRLLQSMTGGERAGDSTPPTAHRQIQLREPPSSDDESRFSGHQINRSSDVPSKTFQRLQIRTGATGPTGPTPHSPAAQSAPGTPQAGGGGGSEIDRTSIRHNINLGDDLQDAGEYEQTSIRYTGRNIPSKSFRMLQSMTGGSGSESSPPPGSSHPGRRQQQQQRRPPQQQQQQHQQQHQYQHQHQHQEPEASDGQNADEPVDIRYVGGHIPSKSFNMLQHSIGATSASPARETVDGGAPSDTLASSQGRRVKVVRLRQQASQEDSGSTDF